jgi:ElaA protein
MKIAWRWHRFAELSGMQVHEILTLRQEIFVVEQNCVYCDADWLDALSWHLAGWNEAEEMVSYARLTDPGSRYDVPSIGRLLTVKKRRSSGLARRAVEMAIDKARQEYGKTAVRIAAQSHLQKFYTTLGFMPISEIYDEDGIDHIDMLLK